MADFSVQRLYLFCQPTQCRQRQRVHAALGTKNARPRLREIAGKLRAVCTLPTGFRGFKYSEWTFALHCGIMPQMQVKW
jgi:hypothetical protein